MTKASIEDIVLDTLDLSTIGSHMKRKIPSVNSRASSSTHPTNLSLDIDPKIAPTPLSLTWESIRTHSKTHPLRSSKELG